MSDLPAWTCKKVFIALGGTVIIVAVLCYVAIWVEGLPGPHHGAYLARASLHNIYGGLQDYDDKTGRLPPATATDVASGSLSTWRIEVYQSSVDLGFISPPETNPNLPIDFNRRKAWNDPDNIRLEGFGAWLFRYTQVDADPKRNTGKYGSLTGYYKAITGPDTAFASTTPTSLKQLPKNLILVVRVERSETHWMEPGDLSIQELAPSDETKRLLLGDDGYVVLFADGDGWVLSGKTPISDLCKFFTIASARQLDREKTLGPYRVLP
jgi:hypothetical protein